jgi:hypothetical protein
MFTSSREFDHIQLILQKPQIEQNINVKEKNPRHSDVKSHKSRAKIHTMTKCFLVPVFIQNNPHQIFNKTGDTQHKVSKVDSTTAR